MKLKSYVIVGLVGVLTLFTSCADKNYYEEHVTNVNGAEVTTITRTVEIDDWHWVAEYGRYEATFADKLIQEMINDKVFKYGDVIASIFIKESVNGESYETWKPLQYSKVYTDAPPAYTEMIGFDYQEGAITFFIENSEGVQMPEYLIDYTFKISAIIDYYNIP